LRALDQVAYVRFASVYRSFRDIEEFMDELKGLLDDHGADAAGGDTAGSSKTEPGALPREPRRGCARRSPRRASRWGARTPIPRGIGGGAGR
jgi:hypothetical protein